MNIKLTNLGKRYNREWIFRNLNFQFDTNKHYAITGPNGSGKSTLLQTIAGSIIYNEGEIEYHQQQQKIESEKIFKQISFTSPAFELVEEMTLVEFFNFHHKMKGWLPGIDSRQIISLLNLGNSTHKQLRYFSSGMKQRVKLGQAIFSDVPTVFLDEPATNLDEEGVKLYKKLVESYCQERLVIVSSNDQNEYSFCEESIDMLRYK